MLARFEDPLNFTKTPMNRSYSASMTRPDELARFVQESLNPEIEPSIEILDGDFQAFAQTLNLGTVSLMKVKCSPLIISSQLISEREKSLDTSQIHAKLQLKGSTEVTVNGKTLVSKPGDWIIHSSYKPYTVQNSVESEIVVLLFSWYDLYPDAPNMRPLSNRLMTSDQGTSKLLFGFVAGLFEEFDNTPKTSCRALSDIVLQMVKAAALEANSKDSEPDKFQIIYDDIRSFIAKNLAEPELNIDLIAAKFNCSKRYLHRIFHDQGQGDTIGNYILKRRLMQCHYELSASEFSHKSVSKIAYSWGFSDPSHFSRSFKSFYNIAPRTLRQNNMKETDS